MPRNRNRADAAGRASCTHYKIERSGLPARHEILQQFKYARSNAQRNCYGNSICRAAFACAEQGGGEKIGEEMFCRTRQPRLRAHRSRNKREERERKNDGPRRETVER